MVIQQASSAVGTKLLEVLTLLILAWIGGVAYNWRREKPAVKAQEEYHNSPGKNKELEDSLDREFKETLFMQAFLSFLLVFLNLMAIFVVDGLLALPGNRFDYAIYAFLGGTLIGELIYLYTAITPIGEDAPQDMRMTIFGMNLFIRVFGFLIIVPSVLYIGHLLGLFWQFVIAVVVLSVVYAVYLFVRRSIVDSVFLAMRTKNGNYVDLNRLSRVTPKSTKPSRDAEIDFSIALLAIATDKSPDEVREIVEQKIL